MICYSRIFGWYCHFRYSSTSDTIPFSSHLLWTLVSSYCLLFISSICPHCLCWVVRIFPIYASFGSILLLDSPHFWSLISILFSISFPSHCILRACSILALYYIRWSIFFVPEIILFLFYSTPQSFGQSFCSITLSFTPLLSRKGCAWMSKKLWLVHQPSHTALKNRIWLSQ